MKTVTSEDNLSGYFLAEKRTGEVIDIVKLNRKIKSIKSALKLAEQHNEDLHAKIKNMKENYQLEIVQLETECRKYKQLYEILTQNYQLRGLELKECKKRLKKVEADQARTAAQFSLQEAEEITKEYRETIIKQERELGRLREENRVLYQQIYEKASKIKDYEQVLSKGYSTPGKSETKDKLFLLNLRTALESKNEQFDKLLHQKAQLINTKTLLQKQNAQLHLKCTKLSAQLEFEKKSGSQIKQRQGKQQKQLSKLQQELKSLTAKYGQLLSFSYEIQKDFEKQLHVMGKELSRKEIIRT